jgi:hypothetical protein
MPTPGIHGWRNHESPAHVFKDTSKKDIVTRFGRLGGRRYNRSALQIEIVCSDECGMALRGNEMVIACHDPH